MTLKIYKYYFNGFEIILFFFLFFRINLFFFIKNHFKFIK